MTDIKAAREELKQLIGKTIAEGPVKLASGKVSNFYIDGRLTTLSGRGLELIGRLLFERMKGLEISAVGGPTMGADPIASAIATVSFVSGHPLHAFLVRKEPKGHGTGQWIEGLTALQPGAKVVIVEDVITTGASAIKAIERARAEGLDPIGAFTLVDRDEGGREAIEATKVPVRSLFKRGDFP